MKTLSVVSLGFLAYGVVNSAWAACTSSQKPAWYFHHAAKNSAVTHKEATESGVSVHRWFIAPENKSTGNQLLIIYREDPKHARLKAVEPLFKGEAANFEGFYFRCTTPPDRYLFAAGGYYFTRVVLSNFEDCNADCEFRSALPQKADSEKRDENLIKNPNLRAAFEMIAEKDHKTASEAEPAIPTERKKLSRPNDSLLSTAPVKPGRGARIGQFKVLKNLPREVIDQQTENK